MGFSIKNKGGKDYVYFYLGSEGPYYLCPKDNPKDSEVPNVFKALDYTIKKNQVFTEDEIKLIEMLPTKDKELYLSKRLKQLDTYTDKMLDSLSEAEQEEYSELRQAELQTRRRPSSGLIVPLIQQIKHAGLKMKAADQKDFEKLVKELEEKLQDVKT